MKINLPAVRYAVRGEAPWSCLGMATLLGWTAVTTGIPLVAAAVAPLAVVLALAALVLFMFRPVDAAPGQAATGIAAHIHGADR